MTHADLPCDAELFNLLVCPACRQPVKWVAERLLCTAADCRRSYGVIDGIPVMLIEESQQLDADAHAELLRQPGPCSRASV